jgi:Glycosyl transferases group 1
MNVLYSTHTSPAYIPPLPISDRQIVVGPRFPTRTEGGLVRSLNVPKGRYDVAALVSSLPADQRPDLIVALVESFQNCLLENLAAVPGRKVMLVGDTHHGKDPLQTMMAYARQEPFDCILVTHDGHHLHWFTEAGIAPTGFIPCLNVAHFPQPFVERRRAAIVFVGQTLAEHRRRRSLLEAIRKAGLPLAATEAAAPIAAQIYGQSQITFNCSLNGDLNMRVFETLAAGGFLVTDRLSPQSGMEAIFSRGKHYVDYEGVDDLLETLRYYLARPQECLSIAKAGQAAYLEAHRPSRRVRDFMEFAFGAVPVPRDSRALSGSEGFGQNLDERAQIYETLQSFALQAERLSVIVDPAVGPRVISDLVDLPRLRVRINVTSGASAALRDSLERLGVLNQVAFVDGATEPFQVAVMDARTIASAHDLQSLQAAWLAVVARGECMSGLTERLAGVGYEKAKEKPWIFRRASQNRAGAANT